MGTNKRNVKPRKSRVPSLRFSQSPVVSFDSRLETDGLWTDCSKTTQKNLTLHLQILIKETTSQFYFKPNSLLSKHPVKLRKKLNKITANKANLFIFREYPTMK